MSSLLKFLSPPPIEAWFKEKGPLHRVNEDIGLTLISLLVLFICDNLLIKPLIHPKGRAIHALGNGIVTYFAFPDVLRTIKDPLNAFNGPTLSMIPNSTISAIHLYHCIFFKITGAEWFHHMTSLPFTLLISLPFKHHYGAMTNFIGFFLCGLPGGLNYIALVLVRQNWITRLQQKGFDAEINTWLRGPSMAVFAFLIWQNWTYGRFMDFPMPTFGASPLDFTAAPSRAGSAALLAFVALLHYWNGQYYCSMAVGNYHATLAKGRGSDAAEQ